MRGLRIKKLQLKEKKVNIPKELLEYADKLEQKTQKTYPALAPLAKRCYLNTIETTVKECENGDYFVITGDIPALWLRDSAAQLRPYIPQCTESSEMCEIIKGVIRRHAFYVSLDPYSNAFNETVHPEAHKDDTDFSSDLSGNANTRSIPFAHLFFSYRIIMMQRATKAFSRPNCTQCLKR